MITTSTRYSGQKRFESGENDARVVMDAKVEVGGRGEALSPKQLVLQGLIGCTGMDVASILEKKQVRFEEFWLEANAELTQLNPQTFKTIHVIYHLAANAEDRPHVERAIELSKGSFCGVSATLSKAAEITWELDLKPLPR